MQNDIVIIKRGEAGYPPLLAEIPDAPRALYVRGRVGALVERPTVAVVGTRAMTRYGEAVVPRLVKPLAAAGICVVSGLALGVDAAAHAAALDAGGLTVAVLGSGVDAASVGPKTNARLAERLVESGGALVSEYPPGTASQKHHFPQRNRIIAGLAVGVAVIEAAEKSGALITAYLALDYNRDVFAVPGPITQPASAGPNGLLRRGAIPLTRPEDLLEHYGWLGAPADRRPAPTAASPAEQTVLQTLEAEPLLADVIAVRTGLPISDTLAALASLEIAGAIVRNGDIYRKG